MHGLVAQPRASDGSSAQMREALAAYGTASDARSGANGRSTSGIGDLTPRARLLSAGSSRGGTAATACSLQSISAALSGKLARLEELEARLTNGGGDKAELDRALASFFEGSFDSGLSERHGALALGST